jgi:hypothetical protein
LTTFVLSMLAWCSLLAEVKPASPAPLRYLQPQYGRWVLESEVSRTTNAEGTTYVSRTRRPAETMTLTLRLDQAGRVAAGEAVLETASGERRAVVTVRGTRAEVRREGARDSFTLAGDPVVTTAPDWSDIFELVRRHDDRKPGVQEFPGLWVHPTRPARLLTFTIERVGRDTVRKDGQAVRLDRYRVRLRSGDYLVWADADRRVLKLLPLAARAEPVVLEGFEEATRRLRP